MKFLEVFMKGGTLVKLMGIYRVRMSSAADQRNPVKWLICDTQPAVLVRGLEALFASMLLIPRWRFEIMPNPE